MDAIGLDIFGQIISHRRLHITHDIFQKPSELVLVPREGII